MYRRHICSAVIHFPQREIHYYLGSVSIYSPTSMSYHNLPSKICSQSWSYLRQQLQLPLIYICNLQFMYLPHPDLWRFRRHLDLDSAKVLANALLSSRLDYCNSLLSGIAETDLTKFQCVWNRLTRVVTKSPPFTRSVALLLSLHWQPVK